MDSHDHKNNAYLHNVDYDSTPPPVAKRASNNRRNKKKRGANTPRNSSTKKKKGPVRGSRAKKRVGRPRKVKEHDSEWQPLRSLRTPPTSFVYLGYSTITHTHTYTRTHTHPSEKRKIALITFVSLYANIMAQMRFVFDQGPTVRGRWECGIKGIARSHKDKRGCAAFMVKPSCKPALRFYEGANLLMPRQHEIRLCNCPYRCDKLLGMSVLIQLYDVHCGIVYT